jgi:hypothetical protein
MPCLPNDTTAKPRAQLDRFSCELDGVVAGDLTARLGTDRADRRMVPTSIVACINMKGANRKVMSESGGCRAPSAHKVMAIDDHFLNCLASHMATPSPVEIAVAAGTTMRTASAMINASVAPSAKMIHET